MNGADDWRTGKGHRDENFPVASFLIHRRHRGAILAFYNFVRTADDIADHAVLQPKEKLALLDRLEGGLLGTNTDDPVAVRLRDAIAERNLAPKHAQDLIAAFKLDVTKLRYKDWDDLIAYCSLSAMPVGRFVCDVHGESRAVWPMNDALCAALQIINHVQDCKEDYENLDRVYIPQDALAASGTNVEALGAARATPQ
ncbi:MAG: squalene/phytoene synthase family protein, partial [Xanthobacteraceae bacterium]